MPSLLFRSLSFAVLGACASGAQRSSLDSESTGSFTSTTTVAPADGASTSSATLTGALATSAVASSVEPSRTSGQPDVAVTSEDESSNDCADSAMCSLGATSAGSIEDSSATTMEWEGTSERTSSEQGTQGSESTGEASSTGADSSTMDSTTVGGPDAPVTIWLAGDSTVANGNTPCPTGWGKHLGEFFDQNTTVRNSAAGGRSVRTWTYNVTTEMDDSGECELQRDANGEPTLQSRWQEMLDDMRPGDALLIQFGINDGSPTCDRHVGLDAFKETYGVLANAAKDRGAQPVFITPVSAISCAGSLPQGTRGEYVDATIAAGEAYDVPVLELHGKSVERYAELGLCPVPGGDVSAETTGAVGDYFCDDHTHFSESGAVDMAGVVVELLLEQQLAIGSHLE